MGEQTQSFVRSSKCGKHTRYIIKGRRAKLYACMEHRFRVDIVRLIESGLLEEGEMLPVLSEKPCEITTFEGTVKI